MNTDTTSDHARLTTVLEIVRRYSSDRNNTIRFEVDELISELYIELDKWIKDNPFLDDDEILKLGLAHCTRFIAKIANNRVVKYIKAPRASLPGSTDNLLGIWCDTRKQREGKKQQSRLIAYLHYVEQLPVEEIAEIFDKSIQAINSTIYGMQLAKRKTMYKKDDVVMLVMDNPFFHRMLAWVKEPTEYGAVVEVESHHYPERRRWELRALDSEMIYIGSLATKEIPPIKPDESFDGSKHVVSNSAATHKFNVVHTPRSKHVKVDTTKAVEPVPRIIPNGLHDPNVYELDECPACGKMKLRRNGPCMICDNCGESTGCG